MKISRYYLLLLFVFFNLPEIIGQENYNLLIWENKPANNWMTEAYPIGNGNLGAMIFGDMKRERIQFNENSLWTGDENETGSYQDFGDVFINFKVEDSLNIPEDYRRELNLSHAIETVTYTTDRIKYSREYFVSHPDSVLIVNFKSNKKNSYNVTIELNDAHGSKTTSLEKNVSKLNFEGKLNNGLKYAAGIQIKYKGGVIKIDQQTGGNSVLKLKDVNEFTLYLTAATNYFNQQSQNWRRGNPQKQVEDRLSQANSKTYKTIKTRHLVNYKNLFQRVRINLSEKEINQNIKLPTSQRLLKSKVKEDLGLETLLFQYGRYLLISSSRAGGLPANLQGIWNNSNSPPWRCDYHSNINMQMNYWLAQPTNLPECHIPYLDFINNIRAVKKRLTHQDFPGVRGWTVRTENNIYGGQSYKWNTPGSAWLARGIWEYYAFTLDKDYLKNFAYPIIKEIVHFWDDNLKRRKTGVLVAPDGWSPEHGPVEDGITHDQEIIYDLFDNYISAAKVLEIDEVYRKEVEEMKVHLLKPKIGRWGQLQEWETDRDDPLDKHRHISHLYALHPGNQISPLLTPELSKAAEVSLRARGDGSTGWAMAWKINFWARLFDGNHAHKILKNFINPVDLDSKIDYNNGGGIYSNLLCSHPPFQIDGNFGYTAAIAEMLLQSQNSNLHLLPALPKEWQNGSVFGLKGRGGFEIFEMEWIKGKISNLKIKSTEGKICKIRSPNPLKPMFNGDMKKSTQDGKISFFEFDTRAGSIYIFKSI